MSEKIVAEEYTTKSSSENDNVEGLVNQPNYITKLDWRLIPVLGCTYTILFLDRTNSESQLLQNASDDR